MELRVLKYFLAIAKEESFIGASKSMHVTQPTLSRQIQDLEEELGKPLIIRGSRKITLTEEGMLFKKRAAEIIELEQIATAEIASSNDNITGDIYIGAGETPSMKLIAKAAKRIQNQYPSVHFHISSGDGQDVRDDLNKGLLDFAVVFEPFDVERYNSLPLKHNTKWGLMTHKKNPLAKKEKLIPSDLFDIPLMISRQINGESFFTEWIGKNISDLNIVGTYSLLYNTTHFVEQDFASAVTIDGIINTKDTNFIFIPFDLSTNIKISLIWKKYQVQNKACRLFLEEINK